MAARVLAERLAESHRPESPRISPNAGLPRGRAARKLYECMGMEVRGCVSMPLKRVAEEMRDMYANAIARTVHDGDTPPADLIASWAFYDAALREGRPAALLEDRSARVDPAAGAGGPDAR